MGVVRPSGPLPSTIYWRRRLVVLGLPVVLLVIVVWAIAGHGSDASAATGAPGAGATTAGTGAAGPGSGGAGTGASGVAASGAAASDTATSGAAASGTAPSGTAKAGSAKSGSAKSGSAKPESAKSGSAKAGTAPAAKPGVPDCAPADLTLTIVATAPTFAAGATPTFTTTIVNSGTAQCLVDAGAAHEEIAITSGPDRVWSSLDCAKPDASRLLLLVGGGKDAQNVAWNLVRSAQGCPGGLPAPQAGTYTASFSVGGAQAAPANFVLK